MMDKNNNSNNNSHNRDGLLVRAETRSPAADFGLQWGNRKRLRCMKIQVKDNNNAKSDPAGPAPVLRTTVRIDRRVVRSDHNKGPSASNQATTNAVNNGGGYLNLRQRQASPAQRILRNSESAIAMKGNGTGVRRLCSPDRGGAHDKKGTTAAHNSNTNPISISPTVNTKNNCYNNNNNNISNGGGAGGSHSSETAHDSRKGGSSSGSDAIPMVWPPKFVIGLTNKEKEEDFMAIKGSKLPQRPKKRAKFIQRTLNLVSPGAWLCDLTLERYEVREKKISKKRPRGLKAMNLESDSE